MSTSVLVSKDPLTQKVCAICSNPTDTEISSYNGEDKIVCDDCDSYFAWCGICKTNHYAEDYSPCRHLFRDEKTGDWIGFGAHKDNWQNGKEPFLALLEMAGVEFAIDLR
jgi:hypothetical protein